MQSFLDLPKSMDKCLDDSSCKVEISSNVGDAGSHALFFFMAMVVEADRYERGIVA